MRCPRSARGAALTSILVLLPIAAMAGGSARSVGMAGTVTAIADGLEGARANPANLAWSDNPSMSFEFFNTNAMLTNNGIDLDLYNRSMGAHLSHDDKLEILASIPSGGLSTDARLGASAMGVQVGRLALTFSGVAEASANLPHDVFSLLLMGNATADSLNFGSAEGEAYSLASARLSGAATVGATRWGNIHVGLGMSYLQGLAYGKLESMDGVLVTRTDGVRGTASGQLLSAGSGAGFGLDVGVAMELGTQWRASMGIHNLIGQVHFNQNVERTTFVAMLDTLDVATIEEAESQDDFFQSTDEVSEADPFTVSLPRSIQIGVARISDRGRVGLEWNQGLESRAGTTTTPRVSVGAEWNAMPWLPLRGGLSAGGRGRRQASAGLGLLLGGFQLDLAVATVGEWVPGSPKGLALAVGTGLRF